MWYQERRSFKFHHKYFDFWEIFYDELVKIYEELLEDTEDKAKQTEYKRVLKHLKYPFVSLFSRIFFLLMVNREHDISVVTAADKENVYNTIVKNFLE